MLVPWCAAHWPREQRARDFTTREGQGRGAGKLPAHDGVMTDDLEVGALIGAYRIVRMIGRGGMATVYEAEHSILGRRVAIKVLHSRLQHVSHMVTRMVYEASLFERLHHPGLVPVIDCNFIEERRPWIAMELVTGETLAHRIERQLLEPVALAKLLVSISELLMFVHEEGIVHRDLKPDNILLTPHAGFPLRVIDWGIAHCPLASRITAEGFTSGTPVYMSPEQARGLAVSAPADIFALGVTAYEALTGNVPHDGCSPLEIMGNKLAPTPPLRKLCDAPPSILSPRAFDARCPARPATDGLRAARARDGDRADGWWPVRVI